MATLSGVLTAKGVSEAQLDKPFSREDANKIALKITAWKTLAPFLDLDEVDEEEIEEEGNAREKKLKMMRVWRQRFGEQATYLRFVKACEDVQRRDLIENVCDLVKRGDGGAAERGAGASARLGRVGAPIRLDTKPSMADLLLFTGKSGAEYRILDNVAPHWEQFAYGLGFPSYTVEAVKKSNMLQVHDCCRSIIHQWMEGKTDEPVTWDSFLKAMAYVTDLNVLKADLEKEF